MCATVVDGQGDHDLVSKDDNVANGSIVNMVLLGYIAWIVLQGLGQGTAAIYRCWFASLLKMQRAFCFLLREESCTSRASSKDKQLDTVLKRMRCPYFS